MRAPLLVSMLVLALGAGITTAAEGQRRAVGDGASAGAQRVPSPPFEVGFMVLNFVDRSRHVTYPGRGPQPRPLTTVIRYPAGGDPSRVDVRRAAPATASGPFPLIVFGHGFNVTPSTYTRLMQAWASAGYVVAAPVFPLTNAHAPGGARESDLVNQPRDMSFVISRMIATSRTRHSALSGLIDRHHVAVSGQSDGGSTALAAAYNTQFLDPRIGAAMILSGAEIPGVSGYDFPAGTPPLLAAQGTADTTNAPASTYGYFRLARRPKFLLSLLGAGHLPPYTQQEPQLGVVERETVAFLDRYLKHRHGARARMWKDGDVRGVAQLRLRP